MKKLFISMSMVCFSTMTVLAQDDNQISDTLYTQKVIQGEQILQDRKPSYLTNVNDAANWGSNWFFELKGGASAFLGTPIGCGDLFDRLTPSLQVGVGKWFTPAIGGRVEFQGLTFKNAEFQNMDYQFVHADFMYNVTSKLRTNENGLSQWDVIPYVGVGMIHNNDWSSSCSCPKNASDSYPLAFAYGVQLRYRLSNRFHLLGEVSGMTTARNFDAIGTSTRFGDNMLTATLGLSLTIGKSGWKKVVDAKPYMDENILLKDYISQLRDDNIRLKRKLAGDTEVKVLYPKNSYSGLLSLRARLSQNGIEERNNGQDQAIDTLESLQMMDTTPNGRIYSDTINIGKGQIGLGVPVYFFFNLNSVVLVDKSQLVNLDEIATIAIQQGYDVTISGAADSATGTEAINNNLSKRRADYIVDELVKRGLKKERLHGYSYGGINKYESNEANRFTIVTLTSINH